VPPALRMGKYVLDGLLGPGGVTETYLVHLEAKSDADADKPVELFALKLLRPDRLAESTLAQVAARFVAAARQLQGFHRPGFCRVVDICEGASPPYMVSEHIPGRDLGRLLEVGQAEGKPGVHPLLVGLIGSEVARLLHVGHSAKPMFPHLGVSLQNVIVKPSGEVVLVDAGIAASIRGITEQPPDRWSLVAPELRGVDVGTSPPGDRAAIAADLYSLGAGMCFMLTGRAPDVRFSRSGTPQAVELPETPGVSSKLAAALRTLLALEPDERPTDAAVLVEWLAGDVMQVRDRQRMIAQGVRATEKGLRVSSIELPAVPSGPVPVAPPAAPAPPSRPSGTRSAALDETIQGRRKLVLAGVGLVAVAAGLAVGLGRHPTRRPAPEPMVPARPANVETPRPTATKSAVASISDHGSALGESGRLLAPVAGHLIVETVPPGAMVWVDGVLKGKTFADIVVGEGSHRVVVVAPGYRMLREVVDTSHGTIIRRTLSEVPAARHGNGFVEVSCRTADRYPVLLDDEETGRLCPVSMLPATAGKHTVGIFVPMERRVLEVEALVEAGAKPAIVRFGE
jgi:eukaryotic-like serine/threonine-protein kinase